MYTREWVWEDEIFRWGRVEEGLANLVHNDYGVQIKEGWTNHRLNQKESVSFYRTGWDESFHFRINLSTNILSL